MINKEHYMGVVMVKPHAFEQALAPVVADILDGGETAERLHDDDPLRLFLGRIETRAPVIRDLRSSKVGASLLNIFYEDRREKRYFPLILEHYAGKVAFLPYVFHGDAEELPQFYDALKGSTGTFDIEGHAVSQPTGIRGLLNLPYLAVNISTLSLDDAAYREHCVPWIDNVLHVCDTQWQNEQALKLLGIDGGLQSKSTLATMALTYSSEHA